MSPRQHVSQEVCQCLREQRKNQNNRSREPEQYLARSSPLSSAFFRMPALVKAECDETNSRDDKKWPQFDEESRAPRSSSRSQERKQWQTATGSQYRRT